MAVFVPPFKLQLHNIFTGGEMDTKFGTLNTKFEALHLNLGTLDTRLGRLGDTGLGLGMSRGP